jgi:hypothetical protein
MIIRHPLPAKHESITISSTALGLTAANYSYESTATLSKKKADRALITTETDQIRWTCDGTTPDADTGHLSNAGSVLELEGYDAIRLFRAIRVTGDATLKVSYFGA